MENTNGGKLHPTAQFEIKGYYSPFRLDITNKSGGLLVYIKSSVHLENSHGTIFCNSIQANAFEINLRRATWLKKSINQSRKMVNLSSSFARQSFLPKFFHKNY